MRHKPAAAPEHKKIPNTREISLLRFNDRILDETIDTNIPLLERLKLLFICSSNLDEFFEIRVANLKRQISLGTFHADVDIAPEEHLQILCEQTHALVAKQYQILNQHLIPELAKHHILFLKKSDWKREQLAWLERYFDEEVMPVLSPIGLDLAHPFPKLINKSLNFIVSLEGTDAFERECDLAIVHATRSLPRVTLLPKELTGENQCFVYLSTIISAFIEKLFPKLKIKGCFQFRLTRNSDLHFEEDNIDDLAHALKTELQTRHYGIAVRLEVAYDCPASIYQFLLSKHNLKLSDLYLIEGQVNLSRYYSLVGIIVRPDLKYPTFTPAIPQRLKMQVNIFDAIKKNDILLHHPFESFSPVIDFIRQAARDISVLAIKATVYRTGSKSEFVKALIDAARSGKEVTAVVELRARFDEEENLQLANLLHEAGVLVVYGVFGYKTHAKMTLIVRREQGHLERYAHLSTGNYHANNAKAYTDIGLLTYNKSITQDVQSVFQQLTGIVGEPLPMKKLLHAPFTLASTLKKMIRHESKHALAGKPARIIIKVNALTDPKIIKHLYSASDAGVKIDLIVRGPCTLSPGVPGLSENISVRSILGRFLEHSRIYYFYNNGEEKIYCASADWMQRNFHHRIETCFPIEDPELKLRIKEEALEAYLHDNQNTWQMSEDGSYQKIVRTSNTPAFSAQKKLLDKYCNSGNES